MEIPQVHGPDSATAADVLLGLVITASLFDGDERWIKACAKAAGPAWRAFSTGQPGDQGAGARQVLDGRACATFVEAFSMIAALDGSHASQKRQRIALRTLLTHYRFADGRFLASPGASAPSDAATAAGFAALAASVRHRQGT